jgi:predicted ATP-grasp superfamily ATP-dependent carboligase
LDIVTTYDARLPAPTFASHAIPISHDPLPYWRALALESDMALVIAPETGDVLLSLTEMLESTPVRNLGANTTAIATTASKAQTYAILKQAGILAVPTFSLAEFTEGHVQSDFPHGYVIKPDDGAGCEQTWFFERYSPLITWLEQHPTSLKNAIIQPFLPGVAASLSMLCSKGQAWLLASNRQQVQLTQTDLASETQAQAFQYLGSEVNGLRQYHAQFSALGRSIAAAIPGLNGYVGIDVVIHDGALYVVDINPRITTSYIGLAASLGYNPARLLLSAVNDASFQLPDSLQSNAVEVSVYA